MRHSVVALVLLGMFLGMDTADAQRRRLDTPDPYQSEYKMIQEKLKARRISLDFTDAPLSDVIQFLRQVLSINILVDQAIYQEVSADEMKVSMTVKDIRADNALGLLLSMNNLVKTYRNGVLLITTKDRHQEDVFLIVYDVRDLMFTVRDFKGPNISLTASGGSGGSVGATFETEDDSEKNELSSPERILEIIKENAATSTWEDNENVSASVINGLLVVNQTRSGHYEVNRLLNMLRAFR